MAVSREVWACISADDRAGDIDQVKAIGWALDPQYRCVDLADEFRRLRSTIEGARGADPALLPRAIVGIGRKRIEMATTIRAWSGGITRLVHIGRHRGCLSQIDCLVTNPAFPAPRSPKILALPIAPSDRIRRLVSEATGLQSQEADARFRSMLAERGIRSPWINVFLGDPPDFGPRTRSKRMRVLAERLDRLAEQDGRDLVISGSPRSRPEVYEEIGAFVRRRHYLYRWWPHDASNPFEAMLRGTECSVVTGDSVSMISQLIEAGQRTLIFPWTEDQLGLATLMRRLTAGRTEKSRKDLAAFCFGLYRRKLAAPLDGWSGFAGVTPQPAILNMLFQRLRETLR